MSTLIPKSSLDNVINRKMTAFEYLKNANEFLSSPAHLSIGREYIIRALDKPEYFKIHNDLLKNLVRKAGLYPYLKKFFPLESDSESQLLLSLYQSEANSDFIFHSMQAKIFNLLIAGKNVVLSAPTSMGKSAIVDSLIASNKFNRIVIVVPTIALIDETRKRIQNNFGKKFQIIHHGSQESRKEKIIYILTQERVNERNDLKNIDIFIIDEFYKLSFSKEENSRVIALNIALSKLLVSSKQFYMIGPYIDAIRGMDALHKEYVFVPSDFNTVALNIHEFNIRPNDTEEKNTQLKDIIKTTSGQTIIYCRSQKSIDNVVSSIDYLDFKLKQDDFLLFYNWVNDNYKEHWCYTRALKMGIGIHHGALPRALQQKTIELFNSKQLRILICTSTLIEGVNTVAENVVIYDNRRSNTSIDTFTHKNISGRAGRMNIHLIGNVYCLESPPNKDIGSNVVDLPLGQQDDSTPINLLAGIQDIHLSQHGMDKLDFLHRNYQVSLEIIKKHTSYDARVIENAYSFVSDLPISMIYTIATKKKPDSFQLDLMGKFIKQTEYWSLRRLNIHYDDNDDLKNRMGWYIYADNHTSYIKDRLKYIYENKSTIEDISESTDKEFKIVKNIFKHSIPRALMLFQDLLNYRLSQLSLEKKVDLGLTIHIFENSHLPATFSALEEMGVAIETLEKLLKDNLNSASIESLSRYIRINYKSLPNLTPIDHMFINLSLF
ncbi:TPA: DEAD/DEAH box helicase [Aeromonas hydrophila]|nr:DEAD/DEAH box helicase [Aeromonas hydrophila]HAU4975496.1 DEAD/DEAH box helicase [Aeromonas hydrophila]HAU4984901.1 DEAD/DEAH box helicase [Aeromonas hydrophila]